MRPTLPLGKRVKRRFSLTRSTDFQRVRRYGKSYAHPLVVLVALPNETGLVHVGIAVGRNIGNAVKRNRIKRLLRAAVVPFLGLVKPGWDFLLIARKPILEVDFLQVQTAVETVLARARLMSGSAVMVDTVDG